MRVSDYKNGDLKITCKKKLWCLGYHIKDHRLLWPIQDHKTYFVQPHFLAQKWLSPHNMRNLGKKLEGPEQTHEYGFNI